MASTLERLFLFAKAKDAEQRENFTTEALAGAIRSDPEPLFAALRARGVHAQAEDMVVETQLWLAGTGRLDLVVEHGPRSARRSIWVEVKVDAPVDHDQLTRYRNRAAQEGRGTEVLLLTRELPELPPGVRGLTWHDVWEGIRVSAATPLWTELKTYLEENQIADMFLQPVTSAEAAALGTAASLLGKVTRILDPFAVKAKAEDLWPASHWNTGDKLAEEVFRTLLADGTESINSRSRDVAGAAAGARWRKEGGPAYLGLWVWADPRRALQGAERICRQADAGGLDAKTWERHAVGWEALLALHRLDEFQRQPEATEWLVARLQELEKAGVLELLGTLG